VLIAMDAIASWLTVVAVLTLLTAVPVIWFGRWSDDARILVRTVYWLAILAFLPHITDGPPERWIVVTFALTVAAVMQYRWRQRVLVVPGLIAVSAVTTIAAGGSPEATAVGLGIVGIGWLLGSQMRASLQRRVAYAGEARERAARARRILSALTEMTTLDPAGTIDAIADGIVAIGFPTGGIGEYADGKIRHLALGGAPGVPSVVPAGTGVTGQAIAANRTVVVRDYQDWSERWQQAPSRIGALIATPLRVGDEIVGVMTGGAFEPTDWTDEDVELLESLAVHASRALEFLRRYRREQELAARLAELDRMKSIFLAEVSQEFRTPLTVIRGVSSTLTRRGGDLPPDTASDLLRRLLEQAERLEAMTVDVLRLAGRSDIEHGFQVEAVDVAQIVAAAIHEAAHGRALPVELTVAGPAVVEGDADLLHRAVRTLLEDAVHGVGSEPVRVRVRRAGREVHVTFIGIAAPEWSRGVRGALVDHALAAHGSSLEEHDHGFEFRLRARDDRLSDLTRGAGA
jgi:GAF domain-containing protein